MYPFLSLLQMEYFSPIAHKTFSYVLTLDEFRRNMPEGHNPSWIRMSTITMVSTIKREINIEQLREKFIKLGASQTEVTLADGSKKVVEPTCPIRLVQSDKPDSEGFAWFRKTNNFMNQITIQYRDKYSTKSVKIFPNGSIQTAGCSDLFDCLRLIAQLECLYRELEISDVDVPVDSYHIVMINTNFSLNYSINPMKVLEHFSGHSLFEAEFKPDLYSAVKIKFKPAADMKTVTVSIFATGKVIITGAETLKEIAFAYNIINHHMASRPDLKVGPSQESGVFDVFMGYRFEDWVPVLKKLGARPWIFDRENCKINF